MTKTSRPKGAKRGRLHEPPRQMKIFRAISWYAYFGGSNVGEYISHILMELGRLGLDIREIENHSRAPNRQTVLSDLLEWLNDHPGDAYSKLTNWQNLDIDFLQSRGEPRRPAKPRIEVSAQLTKMRNLSVRWHPAGWRDSEIDWHRSERNYFNLIDQRIWRQPPDFLWFEGDEDPTFDSRPSNELMYLRGVDHLRPEPRDRDGFGEKYNSDVVDSILICAVRAAYEGLILQLSRNFDVHVIDAFDFVVRDEIDAAEPSSYPFKVHRVVQWSLENAENLEERRRKIAAEEQEARDLAQLKDFYALYGFSIDEFVEILVRNSSRKAKGAPPSAELTNRDAAKELRKLGFSIDAGGVRRIRKLIATYMTDSLPDILREGEVPQPLVSPNNVVNFRKSDG